MTKLKKYLDTISFVYSMLGHLKKMFWLCVLMFVAQAAWEAVVLGSVATFFEGVLNTTSVQSKTMVNSPLLEKFYSLFGGLSSEHKSLLGFGLASFSLLIKSLLQILIMIYRTKFSTLFICKIREDVFNGLMRSSMSFFDNSKKGSLMQMVINETRSCYSLLKVLLDMIVYAFMVAAYIVLMFLVSTKLSMLVLAACIIFVAQNFFVGRLIKRNSGKYTQKYRVLTAVAEESLGGIKQVKLFNFYKPLLERFSESCMAADMANRKSALLIAWQLTISNLLGIIVFLLIFIVNAKGSILSIAALLAFLYLIKSLITNLTGLNQKYGFMNSNIPAVDNVIDFLNEAKVHEEDSGEKTQDCLFEKHISFKNVSLKYGEKNILNSVNLEIAKGSSIALVGESGSGKTSLANLLPKLYTVNGGDIYFDGISINKFNLSFLRTKIASVNQESILFNMSIEDNILMANPKADHSHVVKAAQKAFAHEFIESLPEKYNTLAGDRGVKLSGGQRQRINIAQVFAKDSEIVIFDEATSALDTKSEKYIQQAIREMEQEKTCLIIAHRLSTIRNVDMIVVLDKGNIIEKGSWDKLIEKKGKFYEMLQHQSFSV